MKGSPVRVRASALAKGPQMRAFVGRIVGATNGSANISANTTCGGGSVESPAHPARHSRMRRLLDRCRGIRHSWPGGRMRMGVLRGLREPVDGASVVHRTDYRC